MKALVTGAAHGLGRALTEELLRRGPEVVAADRETDPLDDLPLAYRGSCTIRFVNLEKTDSIERLLTSLKGMEFDLVILNAGVSATGKFEEIPSAIYSRLIAVNFFAPLALSAALVGRDLMARKGKIVFISSLSHALGYPGASVYAATKDAIAAYARSVRKPFRKRRVRLLTVFPGPIRTSHAAKHAPAESDPELRMDPNRLAIKILQAARRRSRTYYPGARAGAAALFGKLAPEMATRMMRKSVFEKLKGPEY